MINHIRRMNRELTPSEHLILHELCTGNSNLSISKKTHLPIKTVENAISRSARVFGIDSHADINLRVLLALAYEANFEHGKNSPIEITIAHCDSL